MRQDYPPAEANGIAPVNRTVQQTAATDANASLPTGHSARSTAGMATDLIPAGMLNEFVYCPRLFYYEFVEGMFVRTFWRLEPAVEETVQRQPDDEAGDGTDLRAGSAASPD